VGISKRDAEQIVLWEHEIHRLNEPHHLTTMTFDLADETGAFLNSIAEALNVSVSAVVCQALTKVIDADHKAGNDAR
jgi:hypothetical protein